MFKKIAAAAVFAVALTGGVMAQGNSGGGGNNSNSEGLVNVTLGDVVLQQIASDINVDVSQIPVTVEVPVGVAANVCGVAANVLAEQKNAGEAACDATTSSQALTQVVQQQVSSQQ